MILGCSEYFGDIELITGSKRTHTVISLTANGILLVLSKKVFLKKIYHHHLKLFNNYMLNLNFNKFKARKIRENRAKTLTATDKANSPNKNKNIINPNNNNNNNNNDNNK